VKINNNSIYLRDFVHFFNVPNNTFKNTSDVAVLRANKVGIIGGTGNRLYAPDNYLYR